LWVLGALTLTAQRDEPRILRQKLRILRHERRVCRRERRNLRGEVCVLRREGARRCGAPATAG
jgi:hypothetical protein